MSTEDKIAAIRREVEERALDPSTRCCSLAVRGDQGVVIYGVPLNEEEVDALKAIVSYGEKNFFGAIKETFTTLWEMLERGKK